ncbi:hypothetical protein KY284_010228 [Solanum tuberosum]|nr:hypothetical protein KY284_010228 [Solanum tuberosum]
MTVKETLDFSARCQGVGFRYELLEELTRREREAGIFPEAEIDKATAVEGVERSLITDYMLRILGLDVCRDMIVGHEMIRGISGGQKKHLTTGEMIVGSTKTLFMDEISNGLDSSTTFQIVKCLQQMVHLTDATILMSLLQPAPETFDLFDDIILLSEGETVYQGPREHVLEFFENCGFKCPERKGVADFLQEVISRKDQEQYWEDRSKPYKYTSRLPVFYKHRDNLFYPPWAFTLPTVLLKVPIIVFESVVWTATTYYTIGFAPKASRFFKQLLLIFLIQQMATGIFRLIAGVCRKMVIAHTGGSLTLLLVFLLGGFILPKDSKDEGQNEGGTKFDLLIEHWLLVTGSIPNWWRWGFWISPFSYGFNALTINEMFAQRWMSKYVCSKYPCLSPDFAILLNKTIHEVNFIHHEVQNSQASDNTATLGVQVMKNFDVFHEKRWFWIGTAALLGFTILYNILFTFALMYLNSTGKPQAIISKKQARNVEGEKKIRCMSCCAISKGVHINDDAKKGMILPFTPLAMSFDNVNYFIDITPEMKDHLVSEDKLQLLRGVTGAFRPGVLIVLMGVSGAGKTTLMDVLAGRKTGGYIEGDVRISGFPKKQETFARVSGYCEQTDIHSPQATVHESLIFSAFLRLPKEVSNEDKMIFVDEVMDLVELDNLKDAIVGLPGVTGLSAEQRKRLTIAVELVANPSIIFMDEPTSGLDARAAAIVVRTVRNTVDTGRTVVCTIHQPSIDIFEEFDELLLMKKGGQLIYAGPLGRHSQKIIEYFEAIPAVPKIKEKFNPATWMLEVSSVDSDD